MQDALIRTLALTLLHFLWQGALIGAIAAAALRSEAVRTARQRHLICLVALLACAVLPAITAAVLYQSNPVQAETGAALTGVHAQTKLGSLLANAQPASTERSFTLMSAAVALWLLGALSVATYYAVQWFGVARLRRSAFPLRGPKHLVSAATRILERWKPTGRVSVMLSHIVTTPVVIGLWRPLVIFPAASIARMPVADFELILLHEVAHIMRRDTWANALQVTLEILLFYHPVVHWLSRRARLERECACDDFVVTASGSAYRYAQTLTTLALARSRPATLSLGAAGGELLPRLRNLAGEHVDGEAYPRSPMQLLVLAVLLLSFTWARAPLGAWWPMGEPDFVAPRPNTDMRRALTSSESIPFDQSPPFQSFDDTNERPEPQQALAERAYPLAQQDVPANDARPGQPRVRTPGPAPVAPDEVELMNVVPTVDAPLAAVLQAAEEEPVAAPLLTATYTPMPDYPLRARLDGVEGTVVAVLRVGHDGRPTGLRIVEASPLGVFEGAVRRALLKWRYEVADASASGEDMTVGYKLDFSLAGISSAATPTCATATASRTCRPL